MNGHVTLHVLPHSEFRRLKNQQPHVATKECGHVVLIPSAERTFIDTDVAEQQSLKSGVINMLLL